MRNVKRLFHLLKGNYRYFIITIIMILLIQGLELLSPLLVKNVLDEGLSGVTMPWQIVLNEDDKTVRFNNKVYKQTRFIDEDDIILGDASIVIIDKSYYLIDEKIEEGQNEIIDDLLYVKTKDKTYTYSFTKIIKTEVKLFYEPILKIIIIFLILIALKTFLNILFTYLSRISTNQVYASLARQGRTNALKSVERIPYPFFETEPFGKTATRITTDVDGIIHFYSIIVNVLFNAILSFIFAYVGMFMLDSTLALLSFTIYPIAYIWIKLYLKYFDKIAKKVNEARSHITAKINEIINGIQILQVFNFKKQTIDEFNEINSTYKNEQLKEVKLHITFGWNLLNVLKGLITAVIILFFGAKRLTFGSITITAGLIYAYNEYLLKIVNPIHILLTQISVFKHSQVQMDRIYTLIEAEQEDDAKEEIARYHGDVKFNDIWFSYIPGEFVLEGVSFHIKPGQMVGLVGHTGSGKSSLMNLLLRFYDLDKETGGKILVDDIDITTYSKRTYRQNIGIVMQEPVLFRGTIASNIRFGKENITDREIEDVLIKMGGEDLLNKFGGINQQITRAGNNMSAGEKQIISLARAIIQDPAILIMDEATSHIDIETEQIIKNGLKIACKNRTVIVIAHRLSTIFDADNIIVLDHGRKVEEGNHEELIKRSGVYANIYRAQINGISSNEN